MTDAHGDELQLVAHLQLPEVDTFSTMGVTWAAGDDHVTGRVRTRTEAGWSRWTELHTDPDGPSAAEDSTARSGTAPLWVGPASGVEVFVYTESGVAPEHLQVSTIDPGQSPYDLAATTTTESGGVTAKTTAAGSGSFPSMPRVISRRRWGADPALGDRCWAPRYGSTFKNVFVHHTVSSNDYREAEAPSIVRGILAYHTQSQGWCDIGYNFLVDRFGNVYEGRRGGMRRPVRGAHAGDYNTNSTGISVIGNFETGYPSRKMKAAVVRLVAWRMGTAYHGAYGRAFIYDRKFKRISGHRDAMPTACPGRHVYAWLPGLRQRVATRLGDYESPIERRWRAMGAASSRLGVVAIGEQRVRGGRVTTFRGGRIYRSSDGIFVFPEGGILREYKRQGGTRGRFGFPISKVKPTENDVGTVARFKGGRIWRSAATGGRGLRSGAILSTYLDRGAASGRLGFPTRSVFSISSGSRARFQHGYITYTRSSGRTTVTFT